MQCANNSLSHGERYTERDISAKLCCSKTAVHNAVVKFSADGTFRNRKRLDTEDYAQGRLLNETDSNALASQLLQEKLCYFTLKWYSNKFQHCFETSQQRIWTEIPQAGMRATPDTSDEEK